MTRGLLLHNPMNLMESHYIDWQGELKPTTDPLHRLCEFVTDGAGLRAGFMNLKNQQVKHGLDTWSLILPKFAPRSENDTLAYIGAMCKYTDTTADQKLNLTDPFFLLPAGKGIILHEQGSIPFDDDTLTTNMYAALSMPDPTPEPLS